MFLNIFATIFMVVLCFFEQVFLSYLVNINYVWYVVVLFVALCMFIVAFDIFVLAKNINNVTKKRINKAKRLAVSGR